MHMGGSPDVVHMIKYAFYVVESIFGGYYRLSLQKAVLLLKYTLVPSGLEIKVAWHAI